MKKMMLFAGICAVVAVLAGCDTESYADKVAHATTLNKSFMEQARTTAKNRDTIIKEIAFLKKNQAIVKEKLKNHECQMRVYIIQDRATEAGWKGEGFCPEALDFAINGIVQDYIYERELKRLRTENEYWQKLPAEIKNSVCQK